METRHVDAGRFDALFVAIMPVLHVRLAAVCADRRDAEDVLHDLYVRLRRTPAVLQTVLRHPNPVGYLQRAAVNMAHDKWRGEHRRQRLVDRVAPQADLAWDGGVGRCDNLLMVSSALRTLSHAERAAVLLVDVQGQTLDTAARLLGVHRGTVQRNRQRALERLRRAIQRRGHQDRAHTSTRAQT
jgi:RNA polymerase sigma factor (sigma-70 family)